ncbi:hypothetical protein DFO66_103350 [Brevibacterium sanguinis]|uniref:Uncharacterized protein n=2 Tax=Brevibacterium TaxID=1696 RepID=A0A366IN95_9MICO|nr:MULTISPECIES: hypothetical protein [Brevibacterium]RBP66403.1 hypothetical protein DFO66_103350 [Brevibacterium sanguinis]RBP73055.1 hypothetical protein DFO65_103350 [Brevibacterium celere]
MTNARSEARTVIEHRFIVPCEEPHGGDWQDFGVAQAWAQTKAEELGLDTSYADWSRIHVEDDQIVIVVTERKCPSFVTSCRSADCPGEVRPTVEPAHFAGGMVIGDRLAYQCRTCGRMWDAGGQPIDERPAS